MTVIPLTSLRDVIAALVQRSADGGTGMAEAVALLGCSPADGLFQARWTEAVARRHVADRIADGSLDWQAAYDPDDLRGNWPSPSDNAVEQADQDAEEALVLLLDLAEGERT